jgi:adenylate cyclase
MRLPSWVRWAGALGMAAAWLLGILVATSSGGRGLEQRVSDWVWQMASEVAIESRFVFVDLDERSLTGSDIWPWPRSRFADLMTEIRIAGASQVTLDVMFPDEKIGDAELAAALSDIPSAVVALTFALPGNDAIQTGVLPTPLSSNLCDAGIFPEAVGFLANAGSIPPRAGHITPRLDADGVTRTTPAIVCFEGNAHPSLSLAAFMHATGLGEDVQLRRGGWLEPIFTLVIDGVVDIPLGLQGDLIVPFLRPGESFERVSASEVLVGRASLEGQWAVVGSSAVGLSDRVATPLSPIEAGAMIHIRLLQGMLDGQLPRIVPAVNSVYWLVALGVSLILVFLAVASELRWWIAPVGVFVFVVASLLSAIGLRSEFLLLPNLIGPNTVVIVGGIVATALAFVQYRVERVELIQRLGAYLPLEVATRIADGQTIGSVDMSRRQVVLMTIDLRNFDRWAERLDARLSAAVLHHYVCAVSERIQDHRGAVLQVSGCYVRAVWDMKHDASDLVILVRRLVSEVDGSFPDLEVDPELPPMGLAIGVEQGDILMGTYGSESSRGFSVLGEVALLVQGLTRMSTELSAPCLVGPDFAAQLGEEEKRSLGVFLLEESALPKELFEIPTGRVA